MMREMLDLLRENPLYVSHNNGRPVGGKNFWAVHHIFFSKKKIPNFIEFFNQKILVCVFVMVSTQNNLRLEIREIWNSFFVKSCDEQLICSVWFGIWVWSNLVHGVFVYIGYLVWKVVDYNLKSNGIIVLLAQLQKNEMIFIYFTLIRYIIFSESYFPQCYI